MMRFLAKTLLIILLVACISSCRGNDEGKGSAIKYVYLDRAGILHTKNGCKAVTKIYGGNQPVKPLRAENITKEMLNNICSQCVTENQLLRLSDIVDYRTRDDIEFEEVDTLAIEECMEDDGEYDEE